MPADAPAAPVAPVIEPKPKAAPDPGAAASPSAPAAAPAADAGASAPDPYEFDLDVKGKNQKIKFKTKEELKAILQKALFADQVIKDASQAKKGAEALMQKIKTRQGLREVLQDPAIGADIKQWALDEVRDMMEEEKLTPDQRKIKELEDYKNKTEEEKTRAKADAAAKEQRDKLMKDAQGIRTNIIEAMKKYPDIPQTQATMDAVIQNMRAGFRRFGKHLTPEQAMTVYSQQYWTSLARVIENMTPEQMSVRFGQKMLDKIQQFKLGQLKEKMRPGNKQPASPASDDKPKRKNDHMTEKEFDKHFQQLAGL